MVLSRISLRRALRPCTKRFLKARQQEIEQYLRPSIPALAEDIFSLEGAAAQALTRAFAGATSCIGKYFWARVAHYWVVEEFGLEESLKLSNDDLLNLADVLDTRTCDFFEEAPTVIAASV